MYWTNGHPSPFYLCLSPRNNNKIVMIFLSILFVCWLCWFCDSVWFAFALVRLIWNVSNFLSFHSFFVDRKNVNAINQKARKILHLSSIRNAQLAPNSFNRLRVCVLVKCWPCRFIFHQIVIRFYADRDKKIK